MVRAAKPKSRPADLPQCLPHPGEINTAQSAAKDAAKQRNRRRHLRLLAYTFFTTITLILVGTVWVIHLNFGLMFNKRAGYRTPTTVFGMVIWHGGKSSEFVGTMEHDIYPLTGVARNWGDDRRVMLERRFEDGYHVGTSTVWIDGRVHSEFEWSEPTSFKEVLAGRAGRIGEARVFEAGSLLARQRYERDVGNGPYEEYFPSGQLRVAGTVSEGYPIGEWRWFDEHGAPSTGVISPSTLDILSGKLATSARTYEWFSVMH